jgi:lysophospholipase L1-like esterase
MFDDPRPAFPERNGLQTLSILLETHLPLNLLILMLGTTDTKPMMNLSSEEIGEGMRKLIQTTKKYKVLQGTTSPEILVIVPPIVKEDTEFASQLFAGGTKKGNELIEIYRKVAEEEGAHYLDPSKEIHADETEGVHIDSDQHKILAKLVYEKISTFL